MKTLIVEDDFTSRLLLQELLKAYGQSHIAVNGVEAVQAAELALDAGEPYDLICLDIMLPLLDGLAALKQIRALEQAAGPARPSKVMMTTALNDLKSLRMAYESMCDAYLEKPIHKAKLLDGLRDLRLL
ncbi:MAG TPA: response regulator [bacterium]|jgi:two-component system chemotaxis response regulator CheY|nr:response regulator [bacterium]